MQIKVTPKLSKQLKLPVKKKEKKKAQGTGVAAARPEYPSTNVSSPIRGPSRRRQMDTAGVDDVRSNGYERDDFVVSDGDGNETASDEDDGFEPIRKASSKPKGNQRPNLGAPITTDVTMKSLSAHHRAVVEDFVLNAKNKCHEIQLKKSLRAVPFTDTMLRKMAIDFITTEEEMLQIPGVNPEMVRLHGRFFMDMAKRSKELYESLEYGGSKPAGNHSAAGGGRSASNSDDGPAMDPNHMNVIDLISDDDGDEYGSDIMWDEEGDDDGEEAAGDGVVNSSYFAGPSHQPDVMAFQQRLQEFQQQSTSRPSAKPASSSRGGSFGAAPAWNGRRRGKKSDGNGSRNSGAGPSRVAKRRSTSSGRSNGRASGRGGGRGGRGGGQSTARGIGMMPT